MVFLNADREPLCGGLCSVMGRFISFGMTVKTIPTARVCIMRMLCLYNIIRCIKRLSDGECEAFRMLLFGVMNMGLNRCRMTSVMILT